MQIGGAVSSLLAAFTVSVVVALNFTLFPRDIVVTKGTPSFEFSTIVDEKLWNETPVQLLYTFMPAGVLVNPGQPGGGGFLFGNRLIMTYGAERVGLDAPIADLRFNSNPQELQEFATFLRDSGYESVTQCPHEYKLQCEVLFSWDRSRTKELGIRMVFLRVGELQYAVVDDSLIETR